MSDLAFNRVILQKHNTTLSILVMASLVLNAVLGVGLLTQISRKPIIVSSSDDGKLQSVKQEEYKLDEEMLKNFIMMISTQYLNFNSLTLPKQIGLIEKYLDVQPVESILGTFKKNQERMLKDQVAHEFVLNDIQITRKNDPFWVELKGVRIIYARGNKKDTEVTYLFEVKKVVPSFVNPYGLIVMRVIEKTPKKEDVS